METKTFTTEIKRGQEAAELAGVKMTDGEFVSVLSSKQVDRDGDVVHPNKLTLPKHMPIDADHESLVRGTVGSGRPFLAKGDRTTLMVHGRWHISDTNPLAALTRDLVNDGHIRNMSIRFGNAVRETKGGVNHVVSGELYNAGFVALPANTDAIVQGSKAVSGQAPAALMTADPAGLSDADMKAVLLEILPKLFVGLADPEVRTELAKALGITTALTAVVEESPSASSAPIVDPQPAAIEAAKDAAQQRLGIEAIANAARAHLQIAGLS